MSVRIRGEVFNRLSEAAVLNNRPLGNEVEFRLERSLSEGTLEERLKLVEAQLAQMQGRLL